MKKGQIEYIFYVLVIWFYQRIYHIKAALYREVWLRAIFRLCEVKPKYWGVAWKMNSYQDLSCAKYGNTLRALASKRDLAFLKRF